ncbi:MAG: hypothetical protein H7221_03695 [Flavobacterium sp.]|nr:hypothetical protein [Flavobacterium sp.]
MKKLLCFLFVSIFFVPNVISAQTIKIKTTSVSFTEKNAKGLWNAWSDFKPAEILITIDAQKDRIIVNSPEIQVFSIKEYGDKIENETEKIVPFTCVDANGSKCIILVITKKTENNRMQFYINYSEVKFVYNVFN